MRRLWAGMARSPPRFTWGKELSVARLMAAGWNWEPSVLVGLLVAAAWYAYGVWQLPRKWAWATPVPPLQIVWYYSGILLAFIALVSPLDELSDHYLLSAHMV